MGYEPQIYNKTMKKLCPFKFNLNPSVCDRDRCALWLIVQRACSLQVIAHGIGFHGKQL